MKYRRVAYLFGAAGILLSLAQLPWSLTADATSSRPPASPSVWLPVRVGERWTPLDLATVPAPAPGDARPAGGQRSRHDPIRDARIGGDGAPVPPERTPKPSARFITVSGIASWYDDGPGLYAAGGRSLRTPGWRGTLALVCTDSDCVTVKLIDVCQCFAGTRRERIIDLSPAAFAVLSPLSVGLVRVSVRVQEDGE